MRQSVLGDGDRDWLGLSDPDGARSEHLDFRQDLYDRSCIGGADRRGLVMLVRPVTRPQEMHHHMGEQKEARCYERTPERSNKKKLSRQEITYTPDLNLLLGAQIGPDPHAPDKRIEKHCTTAFLRVAGMANWFHPNLTVLFVTHLHVSSVYYWQASLHQKGSERQVYATNRLV